MARLLFALPLLVFVAIQGAPDARQEASARRTSTMADATLDVATLDVATPLDVAMPDVALSPAYSVPLQASCGDNRCSPPEDCNTCPQDCGSCCGDRRCAPPEDCNSCPADCGPC